MLSSELSAEQLSAWLGGLHSVAMADHDYSQPECQLIQDLSQDLINFPDLKTPEPITPAALAFAFGDHPKFAQDFLRTAVMVAMADGDYSDPEHELIQQFCLALHQEENIMANLRNQIEDHPPTGNILDPLRNWLDELEVHDPKLARFLCKAIPSHCPLERDVFLFGRKVAHIPAMCKINPLYDQLIGLRFRALSYLADICGEDVSEFC